jgi:hypothetical protein
MVRGLRLEGHCAFAILGSAPEGTRTGACIGGAGWGNVFLPVRDPLGLSATHIHLHLPLKITFRGMLFFVKGCFLEGHAEASYSRAVWCP